MKVVRFKLFSAILFYTYLSLGKYSYAQDLYYFDIKEQQLNKALIEFAIQSDKTLLYSYLLTQSKSSTQIKGYYSPQYALSKLLRNSSIKFKSINDDQFSLFAQKQSNTSDAKNKSPIILNTNVVAEKEAIEVINILGKSTLARTLNELPVPVDILSQKALTDTGQLEVARMIQSIAPSFNFSSSAISDGTDALQPATLRGLGPDQTLILVNGKRRHQASLLHINSSVGRGTTGSDINAIPIEAIKRIEILRDGAAAKYGSDAIAGVINIVLNDQLKATQFNSTFGQYSAGDGFNSKLSLSRGLSIGSRGSLNATAVAHLRDSTNRAGLFGTCLYSDCTTNPNGDVVTNSEIEITADRDVFKIGDSKFKHFNFVLNAQYPTTFGELYGFFNYSTRNNESSAFFRAPNEEKSNPILSDGIATMPNGYLPHIRAKVTDKATNIGLRRELGGHSHFDLSYTYGINAIKYTTFNSINPSYVNMLNNTSEYSADDIRQSIPNQAEAYGLCLSLSTLNLDFSHQFNRALLSLGAEIREDKYQVKPGTEYSYKDYDSDNGEPLFLEDYVKGIQGFPGISPKGKIDEKRDVLSLYIETSIDLSDSLLMKLAARHDGYNSFASTSNFKVSANWQLFSDLRLRGAFNTGFRAPSMQQLFFNNLSTQFLVDNTGELVAETVATISNADQLEFSGIPKLEEEKSNNYSLGLIYTPLENLNITLDYYHIDIYDRIVLSDQLAYGLSEKLDNLLTFKNVDKVQLFLNGANTRTQGLDFIAAWYQDIYGGKLTATLAANITETKVKSLYTPQGSGLSNLLNTQVFSKQDISIIESWQPNHRINLTTSFQKEKWNASLTLNRYGSYTIIDGGEQKYSAKLITDIKANFNLNKAITLHIGVNNLFNVTPDKNTIGNSHQGTIKDRNNNLVVESDGVFNYSRRSAPFGFNGRFIYSGLSINF